MLVLDRLDLADPGSIRPAEVDLHVVKHRYGPLRQVALVLHAHQARFVEPDGGTAAATPPGRL